MSEQKSKVAEQVLAILERDRAAGREYVELSLENQAFLAELATTPRASRRAPAPAAAAPAPAPTPAPPPPAPAAAAPAPAAPPAPRAPAAAAPPAAPAPVAAAPARPASPAAAPPPQRRLAGTVADGLNPGDRLPDLASYDLDSLADWMAPCRRCGLCAERKQVVFGVGNPDADLMFIGEGPGADEDEQGIPFVGAAGQKLTDIIRAMTFQRDEVYIANIVKCRPPKNRNPEPDEAAACLPFLERQIALVQPKVIVLLGATPLRHLMPQVRTGITRTRGTWLDYQGIPTMPTYHPAYLLRYPKAKRDVWNDMQDVMARFGRTPGAR